MTKDAHDHTIAVSTGGGPVVGGAAAGPPAPPAPSASGGAAATSAIQAETRALIEQGLGGRYQIERLLGRGGMGDVYLGRHERIHKPVAIKVLNHQYRHNPEVVERFLQEAKAASMIRHPNVVDITDFGDTPQGSVYFVMEYLEGRDLAEIIAKEAPLPWPRARALVLQLLSALAAAHARGIVHRDVKPDNCHVELREGGQEFLKVLDFGIAKVTRPEGEGEGNLTRTGMIMGTANYMSPEQGQGQKLDARTDVYAVGIILFELLTGKVPFEAPSALATLTKHLHEQPPEMHAVAPAGVVIPAALEALVRKAIAKKADDRFASAEALAEAMRALDDAGQVDPASAIGQHLAPWMPGGSVQSTSFGGAQGAGAATRSNTMMGARNGPPERDAPRSNTTLFIGLAAVAVIAVVGGTLLVMNRPAGEATEGAGTEPPKSAAKTNGTPTSDPTPPPAPTPPPPCGEGMVYVEGGTFFQGTTEDHPALRSAKPPFKVEVKPYCIDVTEVTLDAYRACSGKGECQRAYRDSTWPQGKMDEKTWKDQTAAYSALCVETADDGGSHAKHPVNCVTWQMAVDYCAHEGKRLPTEAEWEFAARGSDGRVFPWGDAPPSETQINGCGTECVAWREANGLPPGNAMYAADDGFAGTSPVGHFAAGRTQRGLDDIVGNVFEWTADEYLPYPGAEGPLPGADAGVRRVIRGGAFNSELAQFADPALRFGQVPDAHNHGIGFRCAADPKGEPAGAGAADSAK